MVSPFGRVISDCTVPMGSGKSATSRTPCAIPAMRSADSAKRSNRESAIPFARPAAKSFSFSAKMESVFCISASAIFKSALFFAAAGAVINTREAVFACAPSVSKVTMLTPLFYLQKMCRPVCRPKLCKLPRAPRRSLQSCLRLRLLQSAPHAVS